MTKLVLNFKDGALDDLRERSERLRRTGPPSRTISTGRSVLFLRGAMTRMTFCLPAFYLFLGSERNHEAGEGSDDYPLKIFQSYNEFAAVNTIALACRKLFDHSTKPALTGANFAKTSDADLEQHATFWAKRTSHSKEDALAALRFLRRFFRECSQTDTDLLKANSQLQRRVGLLKQYADRVAAHLTLDDYAVEITDLVHFVGACVVVAEIIRSFDDPIPDPKYFSNLDANSYLAAKRVFPHIRAFQLFANWNLAQQARLHWQFGEIDGVNRLLNQVHYSLGGVPRAEA